MNKLMTVLALSASWASTAHADDYIIIAKTGQAATAAAAATADGATVDTTDTTVDAVAVSSTSSTFVKDMKKESSVYAVVPNLTLDTATADYSVDMTAAMITAAEAASPGDEFIYPHQWAPGAIDAENAWATGLTGDGVRVCVIDTGMYGDHGDIAPNINESLSTSFVPGSTWDDVRFGDHGTHVGGIIAAADNAYGSIGIAPAAELVAVQVLDPNTGSGSFFGIIQGMVYAADVGCDIANMSLGGTFSNKGEKPFYTAADVSSIRTLMNRTVSYGQSAGTLFVAAAGNDATDLDTAPHALVSPAEVPGVVAVSALGPQGWGLDSTTDLDVQAIYTNTGKTLVHHSAPGGNVDLTAYSAYLADPADPAGYCSVNGANIPCWAHDLMISSIPNETSPGVYEDSWQWKAGTSMAAPMVAGVAALICEDLGSSCTPAAIKSRLSRTSDDLGKSGKDKVHGNGRVNAYEAIR